jgi:23S rRNA pseudouridine2605 synthase
MTKAVTSSQVRLQKFLSDAGVASRRAAEELIGEGRVLVNGRVVDSLPAFVDPRRDKVVVDGTPVRAERHAYFLLHKPKGVVCTDRDPAGRTRAVDLLPPIKARLFVVGRLDADSTGLLLMTNDGERAERIPHPRYGVAKVYRAEVRGRVPEDLVAQMRAGVYLSDGKVRAGHVVIKHRGREASVLHITLREGRNRQVRRMLARLGHPVRALKRLAIGPLTLRRLPLGAARPLTPSELAGLRRAAEEAAPQSKARRKRRGHTMGKLAAGRPDAGSPRRGATSRSGRRPRNRTADVRQRRVIT